ncbi:acetyl-CoA C-acyltransferase [Nemorincola caseinilytica]|uniref:acetyl-CoA C-acetyltransferase n=1 Tax=Nemorincola caseinilytica TaxID=2054315 RepID=A0ABP8NN98_9BACT
MEAYIVAAKRTPIGSLLGGLSSLTAPRLGAIAIKTAYESIGLDPALVNSIYMGNVLSAGVGQAPARQAAIYAGIPYEADATTVNKVCASGMKAAMLGAQQIQLGLEDIVLAGGMESMSNAPHYAQVRRGNKLGDMTLIDGMTKDGLWDAYHNYHMGNAAELGVRKYGHSRRQLDEYAIMSYTRAQEAANSGRLTDEIVPVDVEGKGGVVTIARDEDIDKIIADKVARLRPVFEEGGALTAANSSNLNDGAAALVLASAAAVQKYGLRPLARIVSYADAAQAPEWFTTSPAVAIPKALAKAGIGLKDVDRFEINEAYASVILSIQQILGLDLGKVNVYGGAVAMGHPIGASGARIMVTLLNALRQSGGRYGVAAICNGGGGASAIVLENMN